MNAGSGRLVTLRDVAALAGVDVATASRAVARSESGKRASPAADRARRAAAELGYVRDRAAASLRTGRSGTVGLLAANPGGPLQQGAEDALRDAGYMMITATAACRAEARAAVTALLARRADGIIVASSWPALKGAAPGISGLPAVDARPGLDAAAALAAGHLAALGHRVIACVSSPAAPLPTRALQAAAVLSGLTVPPPLMAVARSLSPDEGQRCTRELLTAGIPFTAVITGSDILAAGCCAALDAAGRPCPAAVSVTGAGDLPLSGSLPVPLTTVSLPWHGTGSEAARLLLGRLRDPAAPARPVRLAGALVHRRSTAAPPGARAAGPGAIPAAQD